MEALYQDLKGYRLLDASISFLHVKKPYFDVPWHYHPDIEILLVLKGEGRRFVGDHIENFYPEDLCLIGANLPHVWKNNKKHYSQDVDLMAECLVIHFRKELFGEAFWRLPEMKKVASFLESAKRGIQFKGETRNQIAQLIKEGFSMSSEERFALLIKLIVTMAQATEWNYLSSIGFAREVQTNDHERFQKIMEFIALNYQRPISLKEISAQIPMSPTAFCRYFKNRTGKPFLQYLNQYRIGLARRLLIEEESKIQKIAYECGFGNLSHFNLQFKKLTKLNPSEYRKEYLKTINKG